MVSGVVVRAGGLRLSACVGIVVCGFAGSVYAGGSTLPPVPFPAENQFSESKRILGKLLFFEEQLSSDNTMACATCHIAGSGGADPRLAVHPGPDGILGTADDMNTSPGVVRSDAGAWYDKDPVFGMDPQLTGRTANPAVLAMYADELFWDGRATSEFVDPETGVVVIASGGALESQAVGPIQSDVEMAHMDRDWVTVTAKLETAVPMALATDHTADIAAALVGEPGYPDLFAAAFGDSAITAARIGMAIATYERTLVADQTPWDLFMQGDMGAMTPSQRQGWMNFNGSNCRLCHVPPMFTDNSFRNLGLRPNNEDIGRAAVTGNPADRGKFKTPTLRNVGLKATMMHNGQITTMAEMLTFYAGPGAPGVPNRDPLMPIGTEPTAMPTLIDFLSNALTDPRVENETFPFDRPTLRSELAANPAIGGGGVAGSGGAVPRMVATIPPNVGNTDFKIGLDRALAGATAEVAISMSPPVGGVVALDETSGPIMVDGTGVGEGFATFKWPIAADSMLDGQTVWMQWRVADPSAPGGVAMSQVAQINLFCGGWCPPDATGCVADLAPPAGVLDLADLAAFVTAFTAAEPAADLAEPFGVFDLADVAAFVNSFLAGCP